jgi:hypothetical protein
MTSASLAQPFQQSIAEMSEPESQLIVVALPRRHAAPPPRRAELQSG